MFETKIDYPVVQGPNELYYANHDAFGNPSLSGAIYLSSGNTADFSDEYNLLYGHHMDNGAMFGGLDEYLDESYILSHKTGILIAPDTRYPLEVFAVITTDAYERNIYTTGPSRTVEDIIGFLLNPSDNTVVRYYDAEAASRAWKITALSTCADAETNGRLVVLCMTPEDAVATPGPTVEPTPTPEAEPTPTPAAEPTPAVTPEPTPKPIVDRLEPEGTDSGECWALVNLICVIVTVYILIPLLHLSDKYGRPKQMRKVCEQAKETMTPEQVETIEQKIKKFLQRFRIGVGGEVLTGIGSIVAFILTEDMGKRMVLIDKWTPLMLVILAAAWVLDVTLTRFRHDLLEEEEKDKK